MTNAQIVFNKRFELMKEGVIGTTGRKMMVQYTDDDGQESVVEMMEPEQIHTFKAWKDLGYIVRKGEKARARFTIWNFSNRVSKAKRAELEAAGVMPEDVEGSGHYFMKQACFFAASQVQKIGEEPAGKLLPIVWPGMMLPAVA